MLRSSDQPILMNEITNRYVTAFCKQPRHGLILHGQNGVGLRSMAYHIAHSLAGTEAIAIIEPLEGKDITIEQVRELYATTHSVRSDNLVVIIDEADTMSHPAQNAFLKLLEEPPRHVFFVMTAHSPQLLLQTIHSRSSSIEVRPLSKNETKSLVEQLVEDSETRQQIYFLASGLPAKIINLSQDIDYFERARQLVIDAKAFLQSDAYGRIVASSRYSKDRLQAIEFIETLGKVINHLAVRNQSPKNTMIVADTLDRLHENSNTKLQLLKLSLLL